MTVSALVVGAGPAGLAAAACLAKWCKSVTVVEARSRGCLRQTGEHIPPSGITELAAIGMENLLADERHGVSPGVSSAWGEEATVDKEYFLSAPGRGINLRREIFQEALVQVAENEGVKLRFSTQLQHLFRRRTGYGATLQGSTGLQNFEADIVVDASGRRAIAGRQLGSKRKRYDRLIGLAGRIEGCAPADEVGRLHIESMEDGWWYCVQLPDGSLLLTYMTDSTLLRKHPNGAGDLWQERLHNTRHLAPQIFGGCWSGQIKVFDAATQFLDYAEDDKFLAVGDAAMALDPLSSWGITKGLCDGHNGAKALQREASGEKGAVAEHCRQQQNDFNQYMDKRIDFYRAENRWQNSLFWRSRQSSPENRAH